MVQGKVNFHSFYIYIELQYYPKKKSLLVSQDKGLLQMCSPSHLGVLTK